MSPLPSGLNLLVATFPLLLVSLLPAATTGNGIYFFATGKYAPVEEESIRSEIVRRREDIERIDRNLAVLTGELDRIRSAAQQADAEVTVRRQKLRRLVIIRHQIGGENFLNLFLTAENFADVFVSLRIFATLMDRALSEYDAALEATSAIHRRMTQLTEAIATQKEIKNLLEKIRFKPFEIRLDGFGLFTEQYLRVIFLDAISSELYELQKMIDDALSDLFPKEKRWQAHLTLARVKFVKDKKGYIEKVKMIKTEEKAARVNSFKLVKSTLNREGPIYEDLKVFEAK